MRHHILSFLMAAAVALPTAAATEPPSLRQPLDGPLTLSGNFGELRRNHFHSGVDFKTGGRTGLPVYAADSGYVSRLLVSAWGFGRAVYVDHPATGLTTVYGHLEAFSPEIDAYARALQYANEDFALDVTVAPGALPVGRGEVIGRSGNAGSSGGPHLHFDVRDTATENPLDPLDYYKDRVADRVAPEVRAIGLYPQSGGVADGGSKPTYRSGKTIATPFTAWGRVVPSIKAYDRMTGTQNIYGVKRLALTVDGREVYRRDISRFSFDDTRAVNTLVDFAGVVNDNSWNMLTLVPASQPLGPMIQAEDSGVLTISEERDYSCAWRLEDAHGNVRTVPFTIRGRRQPLPPATKPGGSLFRHTGENRYTAPSGLSVHLPEGALYDDLRFDAPRQLAAPAGYLSSVYAIGDPSTPLAKKIDIAIPLTSDPDPDRRYTIVRLGGKTPTAVATTFAASAADPNVTVATATVDRFGRYAVVPDAVAPTITPLNQQTWGTSGLIRFKIADNLSGICTFRGEIDGRFALFELDGKTGILSFRMDPARFGRGRDHSLRLSVSDACGNLTQFSGSFHW